MMLVSACLAGWSCRWNGSSAENEKVVELVKEGKAIPICPEVLGGLPTPRKACEILASGRVCSEDGEDFTDEFKRGAEAVLELCKKYGAHKAILKSKSPSCGNNKTYDGSFSGTLMDADGVTAKLLKENGIEVISENDL